ncbi:hypothetical protein BJF83_11960 [Nocardiopsis sp. CNR-923]|uniref:hypothetical protein n=1 Tax=Nocardiopsis sp. CNR-923 TaxID=1904965 RepID=UPI00095B1634|nr:hypothetical protein [Nocardiopsis sp. CNR-923]OLT29299.1 hypothetical protein BJF83_11960 [Nocardiopsis sp. CNR-923]
MTTSAATHGPEAARSVIVSRLRRRADAGVGAALNRHRSGFSEETDIAALSAPAVLRAYGIIPKVLSPAAGAAVTSDDVGRAVDAITRALCEHRPRLLAALYRPLAIIPALTEEQERGVELSLYHQWFAWCWTSEAAWRALRSPPAAVPLPLTGTEAELLVPLAARHRFLALSEPYREVRRAAGLVPSDAAHDLFGRQPGDVLLNHCRHARWEWAELLGRHESLPVLDGAEPGEIEAETDLLLFECPTDGRDRARGHRPSPVRLGPPLAVNPHRLSGSDRRHRYTTEDVGFASGIIERHLLPRYRVLATAHAALALAEHPRLGRLMAAATLCPAVLALAGALSSPWMRSVPVTGWPTLGTCAAVAGLAYAVGLVGLTVHGRSWALPWLLRVPAAAAIGLLMVTTMHPSWWGAAFDPTAMEIPGREPGADPPLGPMGVALFLAVAAFAYLLANARNTGVGIGAALLRASWCGAPPPRTRS